MVEKKETEKQVDPPKEPDLLPTADPGLDFGFGNAPDVPDGEAALVLADYKEFQGLDPDAKFKFLYDALFNKEPAFLTPGEE